MSEAADGLGRELGAIFSLGATASVLASPVRHTQLLEMIVKTAVNVIGAEMGSLLLLDDAAQDLVFEVSATEDVSELQKIRVPLGEGVAGLVALSGQPLAVSDAQRDPRHASEIAQQTGYLPRSLLCVPLQYEDQIIGVIELLDKKGGSFDAGDMHTLGLFAGQAAVAIKQSRAQRSISLLLGQLLASLGSDSADAHRTLAERVAMMMADLEADASFRRSLQLAQLVHDIAQHGDDESQACLTILRGFADYMHARDRHSGQLTAGL